MKRRVLSIITALALCWSLCPTWAFAYEGEPDTGLCAHHTEHTDTCGYIAPSEGQPCGHAHTDECYVTGEDGSEVLDCQHTHDSECGYIQATPGASCGYECPLCPIEALIAALPRALTEDNRAEVEAQLQEILDLYRELSLEEQAQIDMTLCSDLQAALDEANVPAPIDEPAEGAVAQVEIAGNITYHSTIEEAWAAANGSTATITLLADVTASDTLTISNDSTITFEGEDHTLTSGKETAIEVNGTLKLESGMIQSINSNTNATGINVNGTLEMMGGTVTMSNSRSYGSMAVHTNSNSNITISGGKLSGRFGIYVNDGTVTIQNGEISSRTAALRILSGTVTIEGGTFTSSGSYGMDIESGTVVLRGGTFTGGSYAIQSNNNVSTLLDTTKPYVYFDANGQPVNLSELEDPTKLPEGTYTVGECTHLGALQDLGDGTHGGDCPYCGTEFAAAPHTLGADNKCEGCNTPLKVQVEIGNDTTYYGTLQAAVNAANGGSVTLLADIELDRSNPVQINSTCTMDLNGHKIQGAGHAIYVEQNGALTIKGTGTVQGGGGSYAAVYVYTGNLTLKEGAFLNGVHIHNDQCTLTVNGDSVSIDSLSIDPGGAATLSAGTYGKIEVVNGYLKNLLTNYGQQTGTHYAYYRGDAPVTEGLDSMDGNNPWSTIQNVTVRECKHNADGVVQYKHIDGTQKHTLTCLACGYTEAAANCSYGTEYQHDDDSHWLTCTACGHENKEAHTLKFAVQANGTVITASDACDCSYQKDLGTVTLTVPASLTYHDGQTIAWTASEGLSLSFKWDASDDGFTDQPISAAGLDAGEHTLNIAVSHNSQTASSSIPVTVKPATLTEAMVEPLANVTYSGAAQKPAVTVKQGDTTLTEGTDYDVTYSPADFTNAGTVKITVTGKGNYKGTVEKSYTIAQATLTADGTGSGSGTYGAKLSELNVTGLTAKLEDKTITGDWKLTGDTIPNVGDSGEYTATFTPTSGAGNYNPLTAKVTLDITPAQAPAPQAGTLNVQNGYERSYTFTLAELLPTLASGQTFGGDVTYTLGAVNITEAGYYTDGAKIEGSTLTLPIQKVEANTEGQIGTITVTISCNNFENVDATINVRRVNKEPVTIAGVTAENAAYDGEAHNGYTGTPTAGAYTGGFTFAYAKADGTALGGAPVDAGSYTVTITLGENDRYTGSRVLSFTIEKASITIKADNKQADVGTAKPALTYSVDGLADRDTLAAAPTLTCDADMDTIGQYPITASGAAVPSGGNYNTEITYVPGTLTVTDPTIHVTGVTLNKASTTLTVGGSERLTATVAPSDATDRSVTWASSNTAVATVDASGNVTAVSTGTATITVTTADGGKTATCTVTVNKPSSGPSGGGGSYVPSNPTSTVTVPVSGDKNTVRVSASVSGSTATVSKIDTTQIDSVIGGSAQTSMVEIDFTGLGKTIDTVKLPTDAIAEIAAAAQNKNVGGLTVKLSNSEISFNADALAAIQVQAGSQITLTVTPAKASDLNTRQKEAVGSAPVYDLTLQSNGRTITDFRGGYATVSLPYVLTAGQNPSGVVVYYLDSTGNITPCTTIYDVRNQSAIFTTSHLSLYFVGYDPAAVWVNPFTDVAEGAWYYDAVRFVNQNGLMNGYSNGGFGPNDYLSRAQLAQILYNRAGKPAVTGSSIFTDVAPGQWYTNAVIWANQSGIVGGYGNGLFGPNDNITREQLAVMLWRYAGSPAATDKELHFTDAGEAGGYALEALCWAVENGVINGYGDGRLGPKGLATRAQVAQMLMNFLGE